jgi:hypothetical protein
MNTRYLAVLLAVWAVPTAGAFSFFKMPDLEVIAVTDMTTAGREHRPPTPQEPVYYVAVSLGFQDIGGLVGGDKIPPKQEMLRTITTVLAEQGYLPYGEGTPAPSLLLVLTWGTLYADYDYGFNPDLPPRQINRQQILKFLGGYKLGFSDSDFDPFTPSITGLTFNRDFDARAFYEMAEDDHYMAIVAAYDFEAIRSKEKKQLWVTRISAPSKRRWLAEVMPTMMSVAGPYIGRETDKPVWVNASEKYRPNVKLGDLQFMEKGKVPVFDASALAKPKKKPTPAKQP